MRHEPLCLEPAAVRPDLGKNPLVAPPGLALDLPPSQSLCGLPRSLRIFMIRRQNLILTSSAILAAGLWEASLEWTDLRGARMVPTDLRQADLRGADRQGADFRDAMLADATLQGVECNGATRFPESFGAGTAGAEFVSGKV